MSRRGLPRWVNRRENPLDLRQQPLVSVAIAAGMGIVTDRWFPVPMPLWWIAFPICWAAWYWLRDRSPLRWPVVLVAVASGMAIRSQLDERAHVAASLRRYVTEVPQPVILEGYARGTIERSPNLRARQREGESPFSTHFDVDVKRLKYRNEWTHVAGRIRVTVDADHHSLRTGDYLWLGGQLAAAGPARNPGSRDSRQSTRARRWHGFLRVDQLTQAKVLAPSRGGILTMADDLARRGERTLSQSLGEETAPLAAALVVGRRGSVDSAMHDQLLETGTIHLITVSGLHLGVVAGVLGAIAVAIRMGRWGQAAFVIGGCVLFMLVSGAKPPVVRAAVIVGCVVLAMLANRRNWPLNTLSLAALILMAFNPMYLTQIGVQLSFVAVATLFCASRSDHGLREDLIAESQLDQLIRETRSPFWRRVDGCCRRLLTALWLSLCVTLATTPLIWFHFHLVTPVAIVANVILSIPMAAALISGLAAVVGGWFWPPLAEIPAAICHLALTIMQRIIGWGAGLAGGHFWLPSPPWWSVLGFYTVIAVGLPRVREGRRGRVFVAGVLAWSLMALILAVKPTWSPPRDPRATFVDVGHGTSVVLESPDGRVTLYDCGYLGNQELDSRGIEDVVWAMGRTRIDRVVLSHADVDHYNALPSMLRRFRIDELVTGPGMLAVPKPAVEQLRIAVAEAGCKVREVSIVDRFVDHEQTMEILHPPPERLPDNENGNSLVILWREAPRELLLTGDLEPPGTEILLARPRPRPGGVMMAPHHGSLTADNRPLLQWARPREVVVSGGLRSRRPEVEAMLSVYGSEVFVTARDGAIRVTLRDANSTLERFRQEPW